MSTLEVAQMLNELLDCHQALNDACWRPNGAANESRARDAFWQQYGQTVREIVDAIEAARERGYLAGVRQGQPTNGSA